MGASFARKFAKICWSCEQIAEAAQARESDFHADVSDRVVTEGEEVLRTIELRLDSVLMRRLTKQRLELSDEVEP